MRLCPCLLLLAMLKLCTCANITENYDVVKNLYKLIKVDKRLQQTLETAKSTYSEFFISRNLSLAQDIITTVEYYIQLRKDFAHGIGNLRRTLDERNLTNYIRHHTNYSSALEPSGVLHKKSWQQQLSNTENELLKFKYVVELYSSFLDLHRLNEDSVRMANDSASNLDSVTGTVRELVSRMEIFIQNVSETEQFLKSNNLAEVTGSSWIEDLFNTKHWESILTAIREDLDLLMKQYTVQMIIDYVQPCVYTAIFIVGILENGLIIFIFFRFAAFRKCRNMMILNLAIADTLSLIVNLPVHYLFESTLFWLANPVSVYIIIPCRFVCFGLSAFSTVALGLQRFSTTLNQSVEMAFILRQSTRRNSLIVISTVWIFAVIFAIPHSLNSCVYRSDCYRTNPETHSAVAKSLLTLDAFIYSILPALAIAILYWKTVGHLKFRALQIPGELPDLQKEYHMKVLSRCRTFIMLIPIIFAFSTLPYYCCMTINALLERDINSLSYTLTKVIFYCLIFVNCCFNPVALCATSGKFRQHVQMVCCLGRQKEVKSVIKREGQDIPCKHETKNTQL
ncbi:neuromedin-B receptor-like [Periplaneta americana]|uniref:neuromedin-B receptor-like n=1 Tax=Periplaneta americana TaxID=6978 RepID=UPI0037E7CFBE